MESETILCSADFHCDDPFCGESGNIFRHYLFIPVMAVYLHISKNTVK